MSEVDLQNTRTELTRVSQECAFLAGAVKELVTNSGRISTWVGSEQAGRRYRWVSHVTGALLSLRVSSRQDPSE